MSIRTFATAGGIFLLAILASYKFYTLLFCPTYAWNQKITIYVNTPLGMKSGSGVTRVEWWRNHLFKDGGKWRRKIYGEAAHVKLSELHYLFVLIDEDYSRLLINQTAFNLSQITKMESNKEIELKKSLYPKIVTFKNIDKPETVTEINNSNISTLLNDKYRIHKIDISTVKSSEKNNNIENILKWWSEYRYKIKGKYGVALSGRTGPRSINETYILADNIGPQAFKR